MSIGMCQPGNWVCPCLESDNIKHGGLLVVNLKVSVFSLQKPQSRMCTVHYRTCSEALRIYASCQVSFLGKVEHKSCCLSSLPCWHFLHCQFSGNRSPSASDCFYHPVIWSTIGLEPTVVQTLAGTGAGLLCIHLWILYVDLVGMFTVRT